MVVTVISGKGGTGKTTVSTNLAALDPETVLMDCDVEEPNAALFMKVEISDTRDVTRFYPQMDEEKCTICRKCADFCRFHAILATPSGMIPMKELCHSCGGCALVCPAGAVDYKKRSIGSIGSGTSATGNRVITGTLNTGEYSGVPVIREMLEMIPENRTVIIDGPPGTSCSASAALEKSDLALLVTEPTPFALSDMKMAVEMVRNLGIPAAVVLNKSGTGTRDVYDYCKEEKIPILTEIPFSLERARIYAEGGLTVTKNADSLYRYDRLWQSVIAERRS